MADPISLSSGLVTLVSFALQSGVLLYKAVDSFRSHNRKVRELREELEALNGVLEALHETVNDNAELDLPALKLPLLRCGKACKDFEEKIIKCTSRSNESRTSFRDWAKLSYLGEDITEFRNMLAGYKATINIALADANLLV
jgi:Fungal N-terminal domain of STAND proteins